MIVKHKYKQMYVSMEWVTDLPPHHVGEGRSGRKAIGPVTHFGRDCQGCHSCIASSGNEHKSIYQSQKQANISIFLVGIFLPKVLEDTRMKLEYCH